MSTTTPWAARVADAAAAWHDLNLDPAAADALGRPYADWQQALAATAPDLPFDAVPADFGAALRAHADATPVPAAAAKQPPLSEGDPLELELTQVAALLRHGALGARALAEQSLQRLAALHARTNACVAIDTDAALAQAERCDAALREGRVLGPLHGVPLAHKDLLYRSGVPVGCGLRPRTDAPWTFAGTAPVLQQMRDAGMVDAGRLHMTEFAFDPAGTNGELGPCLNPWDLRCVPGGSSSGSAVAVAGRAVYAALGSDTGGSIRIPASLCGITGLKPTHGLVSTHGAMPLSHTNDHLGPLARSAADCALMMQVMLAPTAAGYPAQALREAFGRVAAGARAEVRGLRIGVPQRFFREGMDPSIARVLDHSLAQWRALGASVHAVPDLDWAAVNARGAMLTRAEASARLARVRAIDGIAPALVARFHEGVAIPGPAYVQILDERAAWLARLADSVMREVDVLHVPVCRVETPALQVFDDGGEPAARARMELTILNRAFNYLGVPSLSLPAGCYTARNGSSMPVGFQLVGRPYADARLLALGAAWQAHTAWHRAAPPAG